MSCCEPVDIIGLYEDYTDLHRIKHYKRLGGVSIKIDRLIGIITILLQNDKATAPDLAKKFEVSRRTINRDIETICQAGIPIVTTQGNGGGISIATGYKIDRTVLTVDELQAIFAGLRSIDSISKNSHTQKLIDKFASGNDAVLTAGNHIIIDLSSHYKNELTQKIELIKTAIAHQEGISFWYCYSKGEAQRFIDPYLLIFKWSSWYVFGYCQEKKDFRMFKLNRLWDLHSTEKYFEPREVPQKKLDFDSYFTDEIQLIALFEERAKYRLVEEYGVGSFTSTEDGRFLLKQSFVSKENLLSWVLSFGDAVRVIEPKEIDLEIKRQSENILKNNHQT